MVRIIEKKIWPEFFDKVATGEKTFELRLADFSCAPGDELLLKEWDPKTKKYTGRQLTRKVGYVSKLRSDDVKFWSPEEIEKYGYQIISLCND